jgi:hypothetical protein
MDQHTARTDTDGDRTGRAAGRVEHPDASTTPEHLDRRGALRLGATAGLGISALSLPMAAAAVSPGSDFSPSAAPSVTSTLTLVTANEGAFRSGIRAGGFGYFGTSTSRGRVVKVDLADMTRVGALTLNSGEDFLRCAITDGTYGYFGTGTSPARVVKVDLANMTRVGALTLPSGVNEFDSAVTDGTHGYFGTASSPGQVVKVLLSDMTQVGAALTLAEGEDSLQSAVLNAEGTHAYFGTNSSPAGKIVKVRLADMVAEATLTLLEGERFLWSAITDGTHGYFGTNPGVPGKIVKVNLANNMERVGVLTLGEGETNLVSAVIIGTHGYFGGTPTSPETFQPLAGRVIKIDLATMTRVAATTLNVTQPFAAVTDGTHAYFATLENPGQVLKVSA